MRNPQGSAVGFGKTLQCLYSFQISILVHVVFCKQSPTAVLYVYNLLKYKYTNTEVACSKYFTDGVMIFFLSLQTLIICIVRCRVAARTCLWLWLYLTVFQDPEVLVVTLIVWLRYICDRHEAHSWLTFIAIRLYLLPPTPPFFASATLHLFLLFRCILSLPHTFTLLQVLFLCLKLLGRKTFPLPSYILFPQSLWIKLTKDWLTGKKSLFVCIQELTKELANLKWLKLEA